MALQHRGQEMAGIATSEGPHSRSFHTHKGLGMISHVFTDDSIRKLRGSLGIGHTRYSTAGGSEAINCQPFVVHTVGGPMAVAHNGELVNSEQLRKQVLERGVGLSTHSDSELIAQALCLNPPMRDGAEAKAVNGDGGVGDGGSGTTADIVDRIKHLMQLAPLAYSLVVMVQDRLYGVRDPYGNRPLCIGKIMPLEIGKSESLAMVVLRLHKAVSS